MNVREVFEGENRRAAIMGAIGVPAILALLLFRLLSGGAGDTAAAPAAPVRGTVVVPPTAGTAAPVPPRPFLPVDPALFRDPFCPLVAPAAAPGAPPAPCAPRTVPPGQQNVGLQDIFGEGGILLARMHVGQFTHANLRAGDTTPGGLRVVSLADRCGEFEMAGAPFPLCIGEQTSK